MQRSLDVSLFGNRQPASNIAVHRLQGLLLFQLDPTPNQQLGIVNSANTVCW